MPPPENWLKKLTKRGVRQSRPHLLWADARDPPADIEAKRNRLIAAGRARADEAGLVFLSSVHPGSPSPSRPSVLRRDRGGRGGTCALGPTGGEADNPHYAAPIAITEAKSASVFALWAVENSRSISAI